MSDDQPPGRPPGGREGPLRQEDYDKLWEQYRDMPARSIKGLVRLSGRSEKTCTRAVKTGWPKRGWPALEDRVQLWDRQKREREDKPLTEAQVTEIQRFMQMKSENLNWSRALRALASRLANRVNDAIEAAVATRIHKRSRVIQEQRGRRVIERVVQEDVELPPSLPQLASAARDVASIGTMAGELERHWARIPAPDDANAGSGWDSLTDEQMDYVIKNNGQLPPGVTHDQLRGS